MSRGMREVLQKHLLEFGIPCGRDEVLKNWGKD
jgi:hypothetical protein